MTELLVRPYRDGEQQQVNRFATADLADRLRAVHNLRTPDALQAACAIRANATVFITNDGAFRRVGSFETLVLDDVIAGL